MDLDGTRLTSSSTISDANEAALHKVGDKGHVRVAVTGRSLYSAERVLSKSSPIDYLVTSSGAATFNWRTGELLLSHKISGDNTARAIEILLSLDMDFMVHNPAPDNHCFAYHHSGSHNPDLCNACFPDIRLAFCLSA